MLFYPKLFANLLCFASLFLSYSLVLGQQTEFKTEDLVYSPTIKTVQLYPKMGNDFVLQPPIVPLQQQSLTLEFDDLSDNPPRYAAKIVACLADWQIASLNDIEFLDTYNEFYLNQRETSFNTKTSYIHFFFQVPPVKISGNYLIKVYEDGSESKVVFTRRFMVHENGVGIGSAQNFVIGGSNTFQNQQIDFDVNYSSYNIQNPMQEIAVVIRQNYRWDNALHNLRPTYINEFDKKMEFRYFQLENSFQGGNEYRIFDLTNAQARGWGVDTFRLLPKRNEYYLITETFRNGGYANLMPDINGRYFVRNRLGQDSNTEADYVEVIFRLNSLQLAGNVYVSGGFSGFALAEDYKMTYNPTYQRYECRLLLKQGVYNYQYSVQEPNGKRDDFYFEGSYQQTQNDYEVLVYYRQAGSRSDRLLGYKKL